jgi:hypothetical protein
MMIVVVTYQDESMENLRFDGATNWDVSDGHLEARDEEGRIVAERDKVLTAIYDRTLT